MSSGRKVRRALPGSQGRVARYHHQLEKERRLEEEIDRFGLAPSADDFYTPSEFTPQARVEAWVRQYGKEATNGVLADLLSKFIYPHLDVDIVLFLLQYMERHRPKMLKHCKPGGVLYYPYFHVALCKFIKAV
jgi:hypothetical protein